MAEVVIGVFSSALAAIFSNPVDTFRTRFMTSHEEMKFTYTNMENREARKVLKTMLEDGGVRTFHSGLVTSLGYYTVAKGMCLGTFSMIENRGHHLSPKDEDNKSRSFVRSAAAAAVASAVGSFAAHPLLVIKNQMVLMQMDDVDARSRPRPFREALAHVSNLHGPRGFYRGALWNLPIVTLGPVAQLVTFSFVKEWLGSEKRGYSPLGASVLASLFSSLAVVLVVNPIDTIILRLEYQESHLLEGYFDTAKNIWSTDGLRGFYRGCGLLLLREAPHNLVGLVVWDFLRMRRQKRNTPD